MSKNRRVGAAHDSYYHRFMGIQQKIVASGQWSVARLSTCKKADSQKGGGTGEENEPPTLADHGEMERGKNLRRFFPRILRFSLFLIALGIERFPCTGIALAPEKASHRHNC
jgi:hypothetical protein